MPTQGGLDYILLCYVKGYTDICHILPQGYMHRLIFWFLDKTPRPFTPISLELLLYIEFNNVLQWCSTQQNIARAAVMAGSEYKRNSRDWYLCHVIWDISHGGRGLPDDVRCHGFRDYLIEAYIIYDKRLPLRCGAAHISELHNVMVTACH